MTEATDEPASVATPLDRRFAVVVALAFLLATLPRIWLHVPWRDEWHTWQVAMTLPNFRAVFDLLRYDGHPALWYAIVWLAAGLTRDVVALKLVHLACATLTAAVVAAAAPFSRRDRALLICGYFFAFEYAVISRNYALGVLWLCVAAAIASRRPRAYVAIAVALALAFQSNAFAGLIAGTFACWLAARWWLERRPRPARFLVGAMIFTASVAFAAWTIRPAPDIANTPTLLKWDSTRAASVLAGVWRAFVPVPDVTSESAWWNTNVLDVVPHVRFVDVFQAAFGLATIATAIALLPPRRGVRGLWIATAGIACALLYFKVVGTTRHFGHLYVAFVLALWLGGMRERPARPIGWRGQALTAVLALQVVAAAYASVEDILHPLSASAAAAKYISARYPDASIVGVVDYTTAPVAGALDRAIYYPQPGRWGTFILWDQRRNRTASESEYLDAARRVRAERPGKPVLFLLSADAPWLADTVHFRRVALFLDASLLDERYALFELTDPATTTAAEVP